MTSSVTSALFLISVFLVYESVSVNFEELVFDFYAEGSRDLRSVKRAAENVKKLPANFPFQEGGKGEGMITICLIEDEELIKHWCYNFVKQYFGTELPLDSALPEIPDYKKNAIGFCQDIEMVVDPEADVSGEGYDGNNAFNEQGIKCQGGGEFILMKANLVYTLLLLQMVNDIAIPKALAAFRRVPPGHKREYYTSAVPDGGASTSEN